MTQFLRLTLYAPFASWGEIAVGVNRSSWDRPSRSAVLGMLAAALGLTREDQAGHDALDQGYGLAVRLEAAGSLLIDYHTVQTVAESDIRRFFGKRRPTTRKALLSVDERQTIVSRRELRQDAFSTAVLWAAREEVRWTLVELKQALERPTFTLCAGRKSNALGLPLGPIIVDVATLADALLGAAAEPSGRVLSALHGGSVPLGREVAYDSLPDGVESGLVAARREVRRDARAQRTRWQCAERVVSLGLLPDGPAA